MNEITAPGFDPRASLGRKHGKGVGRNMVQSLLASAFFEEKKKKKAAKEVKKTNKGKEEAIKHSHNKISQFTSLSAPFLQLFFTNFCGPEQRETQT